MNLPSSESLNALSREELIHLNVPLLVAMAGLQAQLPAADTQITHVQARLDERKKPPTNSHKSAQPPSRDWKGNPSRPTRRKKRGAKRGHAKAERPLSDHPNQIIHVQPTTC